MNLLFDTSARDSLASLKAWAFDIIAMTTKTYAAELNVCIIGIILVVMLSWPIRVTLASADRLVQTALLSDSDTKVQWDNPMLLGIFTIVSSVFLILCLVCHASDGPNLNDAFLCILMAILLVVMGLLGLGKRSCRRRQLCASCTNPVRAGFPTIFRHYIQNSHSQPINMSASREFGL